ncbi:uncharacterized protein LOC127751429 [Frankliniella occidentalis]|uniref:Uncharacterized protein LOC127751429 n=1 Tax=Frankliniella occidentalis TaxID=133901 RepID=A0A9C6X8C4_FRAOC|nr:uncharacterized protein LOC127751429 [Frankliniella occidentalis]
MNSQNEDDDVRDASVEEILDDTHPQRNVQEDNPSLSMERIYLKVINSATELRQLAEATIDGHLQEIEALKRELEQVKREESGSIGRIVELEKKCEEEKTRKEEA